jgi:hypothetical protein
MRAPAAELNTREESICSGEFLPDLQGRNAVLLAFEKAMRKFRSLLTAFVTGTVKWSHGHESRSACD